MNASQNKGMVFMGMGFELVILILAGAYFGDLIDKHFGWKGYASVTFIVLFLGSWFYHLLVLLKKVNEESDEDS